MVSHLAATAWFQSFCDGVLHGVIQLANALAVYSIKPAVSGKQLVTAAIGDGIRLRFLVMGGLIPSDPGPFQRSLRLAGSGAALVVGAFATDHDALIQFDEFVASRNRVSLSQLLNNGQLPWVELLTSEFNYEKHLKRFPKDKAKLDASVLLGDLPRLTASKIRYIVFNQSKSKPGRELMKRLASLLAAKSDGVVAKHSKPKR